MSDTKYHIHIYKVPEKAEVEIKASDEGTALKDALRMANEGKLSFNKNDEGKYQGMAWPV